MLVSDRSTAGQMSELGSENATPSPRLMVDDVRCKYAGVRVMVLGSTGFIGRWVARMLCEAGAIVTLPVRDRSSARPIFAAYEIDGDIVDLDLLDFSRVRATIRKSRPMITFNLAGYGVDRAEMDEDLAYMTNVDQVGNVCSAISAVCDPEWKGLDLVHVGSAMEYGTTGGDLAENMETNPTTIYGRTKLAGTKLVTERCRNSRLKGITARLFSVYGPGESAQRLLPSLARASSSDEPVQLTEGVHERDFVYVEDVAEGLLRLGLASPVQGEVVNLATGVLTSVRTFVETAADILEIKKERLRFGSLPTRAEEMKHDPVAISRQITLCGWAPSTVVADGIWKTVSFTGFNDSKRK